MNLVEIKNELAIINKNGISFLTAAALVWLIIMVIFLQPFEIGQKNIFMFYSTGLTFPLAIAVSKVFKVDWKNKTNPLSNLGLCLNLGQLIYFPILFLIFIKTPLDTVVVFAIITAAHLFPYGWLYNTKVFYVLSPIISVLILVIGVTLFEKLWMIPFTMVLSLLSMNILLYVDYKKKMKPHAL